MVVDETDEIWVKTDWRNAQLDKKMVEFRIFLSEIGVVDGIGCFSAEPRSHDEFLSVQIVVEQQPTAAGLQKRRTVIVLSEEYVSAIEPHPNPEVAHFRLNTA